MWSIKSKTFLPLGQIHLNNYSLSELYQALVWAMIAISSHLSEQNTQCNVGFSLSDGSLDVFIHCRSDSLVHVEVEIIKI